MKIDLRFIANCVKTNIDIREATLLLCLYEKNLTAFESFAKLMTDKAELGSIKAFLEFFEQQGYLKIVGDELPNDVIFREEFVKLIPKSEQLVQDLEGLVEEFKNLFPSGVKSGGYYVKSDSVSISDAFKRFFKKYPKTSKEQILTATRSYIQERKKENWQFMTCANYFVMKENNSKLAAYIANIGSKIESKNNVSQTFM